MARYVDKDAIINKIKEKRDAALMRQHNLEKTGWLHDYVPVFDEETQEVWNKAYVAFAADKAAFCAKWGCN